MAAELEDRLQCFPPQLQWLFLQHLQKNPFPDPAFPSTLVNLWKVIPVSGLTDKASRARLLLLVVEWARALLGDPLDATRLSTRLSYLLSRFNTHFITPFLQYPHVNTPYHTLSTLYQSPPATTTNTTTTRCEPSVSE